MTQDCKAFVCFDLGDTIMIEETEQKDADEVTQRADLIPGLESIIRALHADGVLLGLIADTKIGTYHNVLKQHGLFDLFSVFSISDELGVSKPHRLMFEHARREAKRLGFQGDRVVMIGNNHHRDIVGGREAGFDTCWFHWNDRYPFDATAESSDATVTSADELKQWLASWLNNVDVLEKDA